MGVKNMENSLPSWVGEVDYEKVFGYLLLHALVREFGLFVRVVGRGHTRRLRS